MYVVPLTTITEQIAAGHALVAHESPAAAGEACQVLLAPAGRRASDPSAVRRHAAEDLGAASAERIAGDGTVKLTKNWSI